MGTYDNASELVRIVHSVDPPRHGTLKNVSRVIVMQVAEHLYLHAWMRNRLNTEQDLKDNGLGYDKVSYALDYMTRAKHEHGRTPSPLFWKTIGYEDENEVFELDQLVKDL